MAETANKLPVVEPVTKPLSLIPVGLKEAALDSPTFRATAVHLSDQIDAVERWLDSYVRSATRLSQEAVNIDSIVNSFLAVSSPPPQLSESVLDHDYSFPTMQRFSEDARDFWSHIVAGMTKIQGSVVEPVRSFLSNDTRSFKDARRHLESSQKQYDALLARYYAQTKTKEPSALREDAFQVHEARKAYLKASMDFCVLAPQLHASLNSLLIEVFSDQWLDMKTVREASTQAFIKHSSEIDRIRSWSREVSQSENVSKLELILARKDIESAAETAARPSRDLDDYSTSTVPYLGGRPPAVQLQSTSDSPSFKQGWLFIRTITGKPSRTTWIRRWFFVNHGIFGWLVQGARSGGVEESEKIGVLLCSIRPAVQEERRFCFEVKTKDSTVLLQAESQNDLIQWLSVFDVAKQKALEQPALLDPLAAASNLGADAAFAVSPAIAPELAARRADGQVAKISEDLSTSHPAQEQDHPSGLVARQNTEVVTKKPTEKVESDRNRDHATRLIQKLDLHRKSTAGAQLSSGGAATTPTSAGGGIASLINSSHTALPISPLRSDTAPPERRDVGLSPSSVKRLAPASLAIPPAPTSLSKTAVMIGAERGLDLGLVDKTGGVPSGIMANQWGSVNHGHISRLERGEVKLTPERSATAGQMPQTRRLSDPAIQEETPADPIPILDAAFQLSPPSTPTRARSRSAVTDQSKAPSDFESPLPQRRVATGFVDFPPFYPQNLKTHDAQFRMLFPNVPQEDRVVLVFRASWNPDGRQSLPGRVFITLNDMYFYSNHFGFVLVSGVTLSSIIDISSSRSEAHDLLHIRIEGRSEREEGSTVAVKTFLEPVKLLQRRLNFLASNASAEEPVGLEEAFKNLIKLETEYEAETNTDTDDFSPIQAGGRPNRFGSVRRTGVKVDRNLYGDSTQFGDVPESIKFRLPSEPVIYTPKDMELMAAEQVFNTSAKALFHIIFGDKSVISQTLYHERRSDAVKQLPWMKREDGLWRRQFSYEATQCNFLQQQKTITVVDSQSVDLANDHLCYVVTDTKVPWHLPYDQKYSLVTKVVITHVAKSKCHLKIFTNVTWRERKPALFWRLVQRHGIHDLQIDAQDLLVLVQDQIQKLGPNCSTKRAAQIFGHIGVHSESTIVTALESPTTGRPSRVMIHQRGLSALALEAIISFAAGVASTILMSVVGLTTAIYSLVSAHTLLFLLFIGSLSLNFWGTTTTATSWWQDRTTANFMSQLGVGPNTVLSKAVYLRDVTELVSSDRGLATNSTSKCATTFEHIVEQSDADAPIDMAMTPYASASTRATARRLRRSRQRMGIYRHDLLVAMRMLNTIERETFQAEYENWLLDETYRCRQVGDLLHEATSRTSSSPTGKGPKITSIASSHKDQNDGLDDSAAATRLASKLGYANVEHLREWYGDYCESCFAEHRVLFAKDAAAG